MDSGDVLTVLIGCFDAKGVLRFPNDDLGSFHGLSTNCPPGTPLDSYCREFTSQYLGLSSTDGVVFLTDIGRSLEEPTGINSRLVLLQVGKKISTAPDGWLPLPPILRAMGSGKNRLVYNKAFQVYAGSMNETIDALEVDDEVRKRLQELAKDDKI